MFYWQAIWSWILLGYFALTITFIGISLSSIAAPLYILGRLYPPAYLPADRIRVYGIGLLMRVQPWFMGTFNFEIPDRGPLLVVSNHRSNLDVFILLAYISGIRVLAKRPIFFLPGIGAMMVLSRQIPVRSRGVSSIVAAMELVRQRLKLGERVHVFPELTRCPPGYQGPLHFAVAPFQMAFKENAKVLPVVFKGTDDVWPKGQVGLNFRKPVAVTTLSPLEPRDFESPQQLRDEVKKRIEEALGQATL